MKYIIIGLGNYGHVLAEELSALGHEIIGADISESRVDSIKDKVATAFVIDATDEQSLSVLQEMLRMAIGFPVSLLINMEEGMMTSLRLSLAR